VSEERIRIIEEEITEAEKLNQPSRLCQLYALLHKEKQNREYGSGGKTE